MPYMIETWDKDGAHDLRLELRQVHLDYLDSIAPKLLACGAKISDDGTHASGGLYVVDTEDRAEAEALIKADPFYKGELFKDVVVAKWRKAFFDGKNCL